MRDTGQEAQAVLEEIIAKADRVKVEGFGAAVQEAGQSATRDGKGMWSDSEFRDLVQYNDGFRTGLIGTPDEVARRILAYRLVGVDLLLLAFLHVKEEVEAFGGASSRGCGSWRPTWSRGRTWSSGTELDAALKGLGVRQEPVPVG